MGELYSAGPLEAAMCMGYPKGMKRRPCTLRKRPGGGAFAGKALWHQAWRQSEICWKALVQGGHTQLDGGGLNDFVLGLSISWINSYHRHHLHGVCTLSQGFLQLSDII